MALNMIKLYLKLSYIIMVNILTLACIKGLKICAGNVNIKKRLSTIFGGHVKKRKKILSKMFIVIQKILKVNIQSRPETFVLGRWINIYKNSTVFCSKYDKGSKILPNGGKP